MMSRVARRVARIVVVATLVLGAIPVQAVAATEPCGDVQLIWGRGTNEATPPSDSRRKFETDLSNRLGTDASFSTYELGQDSGFGGFKYEAQGDLATLIDAEWWLPGNPYDNSVNQGRQELIAYLSDRAAQCSNEVYVLGGYSQGAEAVGEALKDLDRAVRDRIAYVALFGDPTLDTGNFVPLVSVPFPFRARMAPSRGYVDRRRAGFQVASWGRASHTCPRTCRIESGLGAATSTAYVTARLPILRWRCFHPVTSTATTLMRTPIPRSPLVRRRSHFRSPSPHMRTPSTSPTFPW